VKRRRVLYAGGATTALSLTGCLDLFGERPDADEDGVPDADDPAPNDPRVSKWVPSGDPGINIDLESTETPPRGDRTTLLIRHEGGDVIDPGSTDRVELAVAGDPLGTVPLPFAAGDEHSIEGVPVDKQINLIWFPPGDGVEGSLIAKVTIVDDRR